MSVFKTSHVTAAFVVLAGLASASSFGLYAYGSNIGGLQLYYADGDAVVSRSTPSNANEVAPVIFTPGSSTNHPGELLGNPNSTSTTKPEFSDVPLFVPGPSSSSKQVGFSADPTDDQVTDKFVWYGHYLLVENDSGEYTSLFSVKKRSSDDDDDGSYSLMWNVTDSSEEVITVSMRSVPPSNA